MPTWRQLAEDMEKTYQQIESPTKFKRTRLSNGKYYYESLVDQVWLTSWLKGARKSVERVFFPDHKLRIKWDLEYGKFLENDEIDQRSEVKLQPLFDVIESAWRELQQDASLATLQNQVRRDVLEKCLVEVESICRQPPHVAGMVAVGCLLNVYDGLFKVNVANDKLQKMRQLYAEMVARHPFANPAEAIDVIDLLADVRKAFGLGAKA